jgi:glycosyltransferase involved in cell wall biosynthesis
MTVAWFSPLPPSTSGIAAYSAEVLPELRARGVHLHAYSDRNAHDFVWMRRRHPYDLTVFQMGNASCHDFMWAYLFRYPGVVVLHDAQLHQARALFLTKRSLPRRDDYAAEFRANHPQAPPDLAELVTAGAMRGTLYQHWPLVRLVIQSARMVVVHNGRLADELRAAHPTARIVSLPMGVADAAIAGIGEPRSAGGGSRAALLQRHGMPHDATVLAAFGGVTPEKRIPQLLRTLSVIAATHPKLHFLVVGEPAAHYDVLADAERWGVADRVHVTGFVPDATLPQYLHAADICACLRWPTNRETSASWLRCLSAGRTTLITDLAHLGDVPTLDPRGWRSLHTSSRPTQPVAVSIDLLDENHSLHLALERLAGDKRLRDELGRAARAYWTAHHQLPSMASAYVSLLDEARTLPTPQPSLPAHLVDDGTRAARALLVETGLSSRVTDLFES